MSQPETAEVPANVAETKPWYRQRWPWFLIALPATAVVGSIITAVLAVRTFDGTVSADYYKQGLAINEEVERAQLARVLGLEARIVMAGVGEGDRVRIEVHSSRALPPDTKVLLQLIHPGRPAEDRTAMLERIDVDPDQGSAVYAGTFRLMPRATHPTGPTTWQVVLESEHWRVDDSFSGQDGEFTVKAR